MSIRKYVQQVRPIQENYIKLGLSENNTERPSIKNISIDFINLLQQLA